MARFSFHPRILIFPRILSCNHVLPSRRRSNGTVVLCPATRCHVLTNCSVIFLEQRASSAAFVECKQGVRSLRCARKLRREPHRPFCPCTRLLRCFSLTLSLFFSLSFSHSLTLSVFLSSTSVFSLLFPLSFTSRVPVQASLRLVTVLVTPPRNPSFSHQRENAPPSEPFCVLRFVAGEVRSLLLSLPLRPRTIHGAVMATQRLWGSPCAKPPPCTMGKHDQYLNPRDTLFHSVTLACPPTMYLARSPCNSLSLSLSLSRFPSTLYTRFSVSNRTGCRRDSTSRFYRRPSVAILCLGSETFCIAWSIATDLEPPPHERLESSGRMNATGGSLSSSDAIASEGGLEWLEQRLNRSQRTWRTLPEFLVSAVCRKFVSRAIGCDYLDVVYYFGSPYRIFNPWSVRFYRILFQLVWPSDEQQFWNSWITLG